MFPFGRCYSFTFSLCCVFAARGLSLAVVSGSYTLVVVHKLLNTVASRRRAWTFGHVGSVVGAPHHCCSAACGIFPDQGSNPCPLHFADELLTTEPPEKSPNVSFYCKREHIFRLLDFMCSVLLAYVSYHWPHFFCMWPSAVIHRFFT